MIATGRNDAARRIPSKTRDGSLPGANVEENRTRVTESRVEREICTFLASVGWVDLGTMCRTVKELMGPERASHMPVVLTGLLERGLIELAVQPGIPRVLMVSLTPGVEV